MFTIEEMQQLIDEGKALYEATVAEINRLNLLTYGKSLVAAENVQSLTKNPNLKTKHQREKLHKKQSTPLAAKENRVQSFTADEDQLSTAIDRLSVADEDDSDENPVEEERMKNFKKSLKEYYKKHALRPVHVVVPGRLPYRHDQLLRREQYRREWERHPAPGDRNERAERWNVRQRMAEQHVPPVAKQREVNPKYNRIWHI